MNVQTTYASWNIVLFHIKFSIWTVVETYMFSVTCSVHASLLLDTIFSLHDILYEHCRYSITSLYSWDSILTNKKLWWWMNFNHKKIMIPSILFNFSIRQTLSSLFIIKTNPYMCIIYIIIAANGLVMKYRHFFFDNHSNT